MPRIIPPKPPSRPDGAGALARLRLFRQDMFRSQPARLYGAKMAEMAVLGQRSFLVNTPELVSEVLERRAADFPKAQAIGTTLAPLLGASVFLTNGEEWARLRKMTDPAFGSANVRRAYPAMVASVDDALARLQPGRVEMEFETAHLAADIIFRTLFSIPITEARATSVFDAFRAYQRAQPLLSPAALLRVPFLPRRVRGRRAAAEIRQLLGRLVDARLEGRADETGPDDLAAALLAARDPETGRAFSRDEMVDQVAIFFLAGHETSASALSWALWCLAMDEEAQEAVAAEVLAQCGSDAIGFEDIGRLGFTRDVFRETLRLYPPVPMLPREAASPTTFRGRAVPRGSYVIVSPWHLHRNKDHWPDPDVFDPWRWQDAGAARRARAAWLPFSKGPRICTGAGFAMVEGVLALASLVRAFRFRPGPEAPVPVAHLTVRSEAGIEMQLERRAL